jgi:hypothetical protein
MRMIQRCPCFRDFFISECSVCSEKDSLEPVMVSFFHKMLLFYRLHWSVIVMWIIFSAWFQLVETVRTFIMRYGSRLWKLRVLQAELKFTIRFEKNFFPTTSKNICWWLKQKPETKKKKNQNKKRMSKNKILDRDRLSKNKFQTFSYTCNVQLYLKNNVQLYLKNSTNNWKTKGWVSQSFTLLSSAIHKSTALLGFFFFTRICM